MFARRVVYPILLCLLFAQQGLSQTERTLDRVVYVYVTRPLLSFPKAERGRLSLNQVDIRSTRLANVLRAEDIETIERAIPDWDECDTLRIGPNGRRIGSLDFSRVFAVVIRTTSNIDTVISRLQSIPGVLYAERDSRARLATDDPDLWKQWHLKNTGQSGGQSGADIKAEQAWQVFSGSSSVKIGVFDTGVRTDHEDLAGKASGDYANSYGLDPYHGTHVAGIAAAKSNGFGGRGVDWQAQIVSKKLFTDYGYSGDATTSNAILWMANEGVQIHNHSWETNYYSTTVRSALAYAYKMNRLSVAAMGNGYQVSTPAYPAGYRNMLTVGAIQDNNDRNPSSNQGNHIDVVAPGGFTDYVNNQHDIWSASSESNSSYRFLSGTSQAAPQVAGIASLLKGFAPSLDNDDIENLIKISADNLGPDGFDNEFGWGRVNARKALDLVRIPYSLTHKTSYGGTDVAQSGITTCFFYGTFGSGLPDGAYPVRRHEVWGVISYASLPNLKVWGRGVATTGWGPMEETFRHFGEGWCEPVSVGQTSATFRTYVYEVWDPLSGSFIGWFPSHPSNVVFAATVQGGVPAQVPTVSIYGPSDVYTPAKNNPPNQYIWNAIPTGNTPPYTYTWYRTQSGYTYQVGTGQDYSETYYYEGEGGGSEQFTLRVDLVDALGQTATYSKLITKYWPGGGGGEARMLAAKRPDRIAVPDESGLDGNFPNPFNPTTRIGYRIKSSSTVKLEVFDVLGRPIATLIDGGVSAGYHSVNWNASDQRSGLYFCRLTITDGDGLSTVYSTKMSLVK